VNITSPPCPRLLGLYSANPRRLFCQENSLRLVATLLFAQSWKILTYEINAEGQPHEQMSCRVHFNPAEFNFCSQMTPQQMEQTILSFANAAECSVKSGFDCVEIHCGHGYLLSQYLSPRTNPKKTLQERMEFPIRVLQAVRKSIGTKSAFFYVKIFHLSDALGPDTILMVKMNGRDGVGEECPMEETCEIARSFSELCGVDIIAVSGGMILENGLFMLRGNVPLTEMATAQTNWVTKVAIFLFGPFLVPSYPYEEAFFGESAECILRSLSAHRNEKKIEGKTFVCLVGGLQSLSTIQHAIHRR
jgi:2,4-dienoyl-CoA reductase-like NADH-dependent reductase (Old Yellow Enzyme family)